MNLGTVDYAGRTPPAGYRCAECGAHGVKLWREYQTFVEHQVLRCVDCACRDQKKDATTVGEDGRRLLVEYDWGREQTSDQIGWLVPAVPTAEGDTFWGYTSVPEDGCRWWYGLPLRAEVRRG